MRTILEVTRQTFLLQMRSKIYLALIVVSLLVAGALVLGADWGRHGAQVFQFGTYVIGLNVVIPFITLFLAVNAVSGDLEDRTSVYLFTRPISRFSLMLGKWLGAICLATCFSSIAIGAVFVAVTIGSGDASGAPEFANCLVLVAGAALASVGYASMGCLFAAYFRRPMLVAVLFMGLEQLASRSPANAGIHSLTIAFPVRRFLHEHLDCVPQLESELRGIQLRDMSDEQIALLVGNPLLWVGKTALLVLLLAAFIYSRREYDSRPRE